MTLPRITVLEITSVASFVIAAASLLALLVAALKHRRLMSWILLSGVVVAVVTLTFTYGELDRIHSALFEHRFKIESEADVRRQFGAPTSTITGKDNGMEVRGLVYKLDLISPKLIYTFEFSKSGYVGSMGHVDPPN